MNKLYLAASVLSGLAVGLAWIAGKQDAQNEIKAAEAKRWEDAARMDEYEHTEREPVPE